jgi:hypothetical protein
MQRQRHGTSAGLNRYGLDVGNSRKGLLVGFGTRLTAWLSAMAVGTALLAPIAHAVEDTRTGASRLESLLGREVSTLREGDNGRVIDVLVDGNGRMRAAVVEFGGFLGIGTRKIAVDWSAFRFTGAAIHVEVTREQLRAAPEVKPNETPRIVTSKTD